MDSIKITLVLLVLSCKASYDNLKDGVCLGEQFESDIEKNLIRKVNGEMKRELFVKERERRLKPLESKVYGEGLREIFENGNDISKTSRELVWIMGKLAEELVEHKQSMEVTDHVSQLMRKEGDFRTNVFTNESWDSKIFNYTQSGSTALVGRNQFTKCCTVLNGGNQKQMECRHRKERLQSIDDQE